MSKGKEAGKIQVYVRVRPFTDREKEKRETNAIEIHQEHSLIRVLDPRSRTNYFFDGVFSPEASNQEVYLRVGKPLVYAALNGYKGTLLTYGQTGTGKTFTLLSNDGVTTRVVQHCFEKIENDEIHNYKVTCSFLQVYQEKVYDLLNPRLIVDLPVREHPKKGVYVANLTQHEVKSAGDVFALLEIGKQHLVIAETKMVRQSSRSHSIMQLIIERRLKAHIANEKPVSKGESSVSHEAVQESILAVDETINNLIKELKQERKSHHKVRDHKANFKRERECLKELMEKELNNGNNFEGDLIVKGKINLCDLAGSERLTKTKAEGVRLTEAKYLNTSLLELGNVIHALARGQKRHVPYRNSTLTRLLQDCLGDNGKTNFIICIAPSLGEVNETKCSLNFGLRAMRITNVARLNVEVDYKVLAERLAKKIEDQDIKYKIEKLEYLREIQRLKSAITCYQESENFAGKDHEKLVSVIANLSKSVQREKEEKNNLQSELVCLKKQVSQPIGTCAPDVDAVLLAELMSMELLANLHHPEITKSILADSSLPAKVKGHLASVETQEALLHNTGCFLQLLDLHLDSEQDVDGRKLATAEAKEYLHFNLSRAGSVELFSKDCSIKISPRGAPQEPCLSLPMCNASTDENATGLAGGVRRMLGKLIGRDSKDRTSLPPSSSHSHRTSGNGRDSVTQNDVNARASSYDQDAMDKTKALMKQLANSKEKVEQQVLTLMSSLFGEQLIRAEGQSPQWNELGKKLTKLIMFRRNNMPGLSDADLWAHSEDLNAILENCLRFVIIDKALLACLLVIELLDLRQACGKLGERKQSPNTHKEMSVDSSVQEKTLMSGELFQDVPSTNRSQSEMLSSKESKSPPEKEDKKKITLTRQKNGPSTPKGAKKEELKTLKDVRSELEKEITEIHEDTTKLETELFSTMEEKTKVEEELFGLKHYVTKLRSELFHLKLEKGNLEGDVKRSKNQSSPQQNQDSGESRPIVESPKEPPRGFPELSDVMEGSHESNDSENSSQMSDGHDTREAFLKTCMENISKIYTLMPNPEDGIQSEEELSDDQEPTLSDANIDDSDEEIIITKLARSLRSPCASPAKEKAFEASSPSRGGKKEAAYSNDHRNKLDHGNDVTEDFGSKSRDALVKQIEELKRKLHKVEQELVEVRETNEDLEYELDHKKGQLAEAQETITSLENQVVEEKENCEQVRQLYFDVKTQNEILEGKINALRSELERVLRENNAANGVERSLEASRKNTPPSSPTKSPGRSPGKTGKGRGNKIDLRNPPQTQLTTNEMEMISLWEENAELKVKLGKSTQEKSRLEKLQKGGEEKFSKMKAAFQSTEEAFGRLKEDAAISTKEKVKLTGEVTDLRNQNSNITEELQKYRDKSTRLEKDIEAIAYMSTRLEKDNKMLENEISRMESELSTWKAKYETASLEFERLEKENLNITKEQEQVGLELETIRKEKAQLLEQRFSAEEEIQQKENEFKDKEGRFAELESEVTEQKRLNLNLQKELAGMAEYQEALENEYSKAKNEEDRLKQELAKANLRLKEVEKELIASSQNATEGINTTEHREVAFKGKYQNNLKNITKNSRKHELDKKVRSITGTPNKKFYTITHTSEDEIADTSSSIAESPADDAKQLEHENQLLKLENGYLQQQLSESEHVLAMYRQDLESAQDLIDRLQAEVKTITNENDKVNPEENFEMRSVENDKVHEDFLNIPQDEYKLLEEKHVELTREYETLRKQYQEAVTEREKGAIDTDCTKAETTNVNQELPGDGETKQELLDSVQDANRLQTTLKERINDLEAENDRLKVTVGQLSDEADTKQDLESSLKNAKREHNTLEERIRDFETENEQLRVKVRDAAGQKQDDPKWVQRTLEERINVLEIENEKLRVEMGEFNENCHETSFKLQQSEKENIRLEENESKMRSLEEDLLKATSEKLKFEFELKSASNDCERLRSDLLQSESERNVLNTQLNDNIERAANLEIRLMEMRCSCETIKEEINTLKDQKRQESFHLHETSVCKEMLEKRLEDALKENHHLQHELESRNEERREEHGKMAKLEREREQLSKEMNELRQSNRQLEQNIEETKSVMETTTDLQESETVMELLKQENLSYHEELAGYKTQNENDQEKLKKIVEEVATLTEEHEQMKMELEEIKEIKESLEQQLENIPNATVDKSDETEETAIAEMVSLQEKIEKLEFELEEVTNGTSEHEEQTRILEKEKRCLEKELDRVQVECNHLKEELKVCKSALESAKSPEETTELGQDHMQGELELQRLRELNQKLEEELEESSRTIQQLEIKAKALESLQKELHCFHEENDRLTQEVDIIQTTSKAMTDHELSKASLETEKALLRTEFQTLKDHNRELQAQIEAMSKELKLDQEQCEKFSSMDKRNISLENEVVKLKKIHAHLEQELTAATGKIKELEATHETLKKENKALKGRIKNFAQTNEEVPSKLPSNVSKVNKEDNKKTSATEIKSPAKGTSIRGRKSRKESNEVLQEENENTKENIADLLRKIEDLRNEKLDLEKELCNLRQNFSNKVSVDCNPEDNTVATQTPEIVVNGQFMAQVTTHGRESSEETFVKSDAQHHPAPLLEDISVGFSVMAKERLLLETKASHFARAQMQLEQSLARALKENATFKNKIKETEDVLNVLREKLHDLENTNATTSEIVDFGMTSSDRKSNSVGNEKPSVTSDENVEHPSIEVSNKECQTDLEDTPESKVEEKSCQAGSPQSDINQLTNQKERLLEDLEALQDQKQSLERSLQTQQEDLTKLDEVNVRLEKQEQGNVLLKHEKQEDITKLDEVNVRLEKQEQENVLLKQEKQEDITKLDEANVRLEQREQENVLLKHEKQEDLTKLDEVNVRLEKQEQENILLKHEKHSLLAELEAVKHQSDLTDSDLRQKKEYCAKQEEEIKLLLSSYNQEKEALLNELQKSTSENREVKEKLRELQQVQSDFDDIRKKSIEAEKLITELEKDLLSQTEIKNGLTRELQKCLNQLKDMDQLEKNLQASKKESEELGAINGQLKDEIVKRKDENNNLTVELKNTKKKLRSTEKQKNSPLNPTSNLQNLQDRGIQTDSAVDKANDRKLEDKMQQTEQDNIEFHEEGVVINSEQKLSNVLRSEFHETDKDEQVVEEPMHQGTSVASQENLQYRDPDVHETNSVGDCNAEKTTSDDGNSNTNITNSGQIVLVNGLENDLNRQLDLCVESFENDSPREQSTPSEEKEQYRSPMGKEIPGDVQLEPSDRATQPATEEDNRRLGMCQCQQEEGVPCMGKCLQDENLVTELDLVSGIGPTVFDGAQEEFNLLQIHLNLLHLENDPQKALKDSGIAFETTSLPQQTIDPDTNYGMASLGEGNQEIDLSTKRELEWTIANLRSELQKVSEEKENRQQEISLFEEDQLSMKREINRLLSECESLTAKADTLQTQNEAVLKEQILNDEENEELQENLQDLFKEKQLAEEAKKELENEKARLEIELSDAVESREAMERELLRMRTEETHHSKHSLEGQLNDIGERYSKLETVLSCVLDENSKMTTELSVLQAENSMLKSFKIMEITDNFTQFSPRTTEDESDGEGRKSAKKRRNGDKIPLAVSVKQDASNTGGEILEKSHRSTYTSSLTGNPNSPLSTVSRPSSPDLQEVGSSRSMGSGQVRADEEGSTAKDISTDEIPGTPTPDANFDDSVFDTDSNRQNMSEVGQPKTTHTTGNPQGTRSARKEPTVNERGTDYLVKSLDKKRLTKSSHRTTDTAEEAQRRESDDNDSSMEAYTSSSLVSVTDLDISISSDQISSEDSSIVGPELRILQKMQKELAETKCSNVLVKNELSIIRKHNSDLQNQVQKLLSRNNHLKQKMCDRTLSVKRMEKEVHSIKDENKRLQEQSLVLKEEMTRVEKEKAKFERNMSSTKSENKRLKTDLSNVKAESYRVMKELVNLQSENRRLQMEIEKAREEAQRIKEAFSLESVSQELSLWGSVSHGDVRTASRRSLQDKPLTTEPSYLHQRAGSDLAFGQHQRPANQTSTPELSPLMLPKVLHEVHTDGSERSIGQRSSAQSEETMSVASTDKIRLADPVSRQGSQLSFTSETSVPDREETGNNSGKTEGGEEEEDGLDTKGKSKKKIKTIFRKLQHSKKGKSSK